MTLRSLIFWPHLVVGLTCGLVILLMSATGVLLTYERQMIAWSDSDYRSAPPATGAARLPIDRLIEEFERARPGTSPASIAIGHEPDAPVVFTGGQQPVYADAYSGAVLGDGAWLMRRVMSDLRSWHRWFGAEGEGRAVARAITGWANLLFAFLALSGLYLWFPRKWARANVKAVLAFNWSARGKARDFNWHNVIGFWTLVPLVIVVVSAVPISFPWANALVYQAVGEVAPAGRGGGAGGRAARGADARRPEAPVPGAGEDGSGSAVTGAAESPRDLDALMARAQRHVDGWRTISLRLPASPDAPVVFAIDRGDGGQPHLRSTLTLNQTTGEVISDEVFSSQTPGRRSRSVMRFAHTGEVLGIAGQTVAGLVSLGGTVMVWTGFALAWRRFRAWSTRRFRRGEPSESARSSAA